MIPTLIFVGVGFGLVAGHWEHRVVATLACSVPVAAAWGLLVGAPLGGTLLAFVNIAVGIALGFGLRRLGDAVLHRSRHAPGASRR